MERALTSKEERFLRRKLDYYEWHRLFDVCVGFTPIEAMFCFWERVAFYCIRCLLLIHETQNPQGVTKTVSAPLKPPAMLMHASACLLDYIVCCNISSTLCYWPNTQSDVGSLACLRNMLHGGGAPLFVVSSPNSNSQLLKPRGGIALLVYTTALIDSWRLA